MAHFDHLLASWRRSLNDGGALSHGDLDELEGHVREIVENDLVPLGLRYEEAMLVALRRVGDPSVLTMEFARVSPGRAWATRFYWMGIGFIGLSGALYATRLIAWAAAGATAALGGTTTAMIAAYLGTGLPLALGLVGVLWLSTRTPDGASAHVLKRIVTWFHSHPALATASLFIGLAAMKLFENAHYFFVYGPQANDLGPLWMRLWFVETGVFIMVPVLLVVLARRLAIESDPDSYDGLIAS